MSSHVDGVKVRSTKAYLARIEEHHQGTQRLRSLREVKDDSAVWQTWAVCSVIVHNILNCNALNAVVPVQT